MGLHVHIAAATVSLDPMSRDPEFLPVLRPRWDSQHHAFAVERLHLDARSQQRLREIDRDDADHVEALATEEAIGCDVDDDDEVALSLGSLVLEPQASTVLDPRRHFDGDALFDADFAAALTRWTALRRNRALPAAHRARTIDGEAPLSE